MKLLLFLTLLPIFAPPYLLLHYTYGDTQGKGGWQGMFDKGLPWKVLAVLLGIIYVPAILVMRYLAPRWEKLLD